MNKVIKSLYRANILAIKKYEYRYQKKLFFLNKYAFLNTVNPKYYQHNLDYGFKMLKKLKDDPNFIISFLEKRYNIKKLK